jgi:hypothetical protein
MKISLKSPDIDVGIKMFLQDRCNLFIGDSRYFLFEDGSSKLQVSRSLFVPFPLRPSFRWRSKKHIRQSPQKRMPIVGIGRVKPNALKAFCIESSKSGRSVVAATALMILSRGFFKFGSDPDPNEAIIFPTV